MLQRHHGAVAAEAENYAVELLRIVRRTENQKIEAGSVQKARQNFGSGRGAIFGNYLFGLGSGGHGHLRAGALVHGKQNLRQAGLVGADGEQPVAKRNFQRLGGSWWSLHGPAGSVVAG